MRNRKKILIVVNMLSLIFWGCSRNDDSKKEEVKKKSAETVTLSMESIKQINLEMDSVRMQPFTGYISIPARIIANQDNEAQIGSLVQGRVHQVFVKAGDYVKKGQVLMTIEGLDVGEIKAGFLIAKAALDYTKANYERQKKLYDEKICSQKTLLESRAEYEKALAGYKAEDKKIHSLGMSDEDITDGKKNEEHTSGTLPIKSSINGIVVERNVVIGQLVDASTNAFRIINANIVWADGQIYEKDMPKFNKKTNLVFVSSVYPDEKYNGKTIYIGQVVDEQTRTITVRGEINNANGKLKPQMFGELKIPVTANVKTIMIPDEACIKEAGQKYVFVLKNDTTFEKRIVKTGSSANNMVEIKDGLNEGERIVSKGVFYLKSELKKEELEGDED